MAIDKIKAVAVFDGTIDTADIADDAITSAKIEDGSVTLAKTDNLFENTTFTGTDSITVPKGTTAQQPASVSAGQVRFDSDKGVLTYSDGTSWAKVSKQLAVLSSISGVILEDAETTLSLTGTGFLTDTLTVNFAQSSDAIDVDVDVTATSDTAATVTVPSSVYSNVTAGNSVSITVTNTDLSTSDPLTKTCVASPTGGTVVTSGSVRTHYITSSTNFVVASGVSFPCEMLLVAGGGSGGTHSGGGGGAGGMLWYSDTTIDGKTPQSGKVTIGAGTHTCTIGAGGGPSATSGGYGSYSGYRSDTHSSNPASYVDGKDGGNSSIAISGGSTYTVTGGGGGGCGQGGAWDGGSGGGGSRSQGAGSGTSGQGNNGGTAVTGGVYPGGGGGGAKSAGQSVSNTEGGDGGAGFDFSSKFSTSYGDSGAFGGGGGGNAQESPWGLGTGGVGGGGNGGDGNGNYAQDGDTNSGGGSGGNQYNSGASNHSQGGSGIIIISYDTDDVVAS